MVSKSDFTDKELKVLTALIDSDGVSAAELGLSEQELVELIRSIEVKAGVNVMRSDSYLN